VDESRSCFTLPHPSACAYEYVTATLVESPDLCGEEVKPDYPHDEVANPGVNHFPDGVFQKCRTVTAREKEAERQRLRKLRRVSQLNRNGNAAPGVRRNTVAPTGDWDLPAASDQPSGSRPGQRMVIEAIDEQWSQALIDENANARMRNRRASY
jgi:hypothetical protein